MKSAGTTTVGARAGKAAAGSALRAKKSTGVAKVTVSLPASLVERVRRMPGGTNLSGVVASALEAWEANARLGQMLDELDEQCGPVPAEVQAEVDAKWDPIFDAMREQRRASA